MYRHSIIPKILLLSIVLIAVSSCDNKDKTIAPSLQLSALPGTTQNGDTLGMGCRMKFYINADGNGTKITNLVVKMKSNLMKKEKVMIDEGMYTDRLDRVINLNKPDISDMCVVFQIMNSHRQLVYDTICITGQSDTCIYPILHHRNIRLGYQKAKSIPQYANLEKGIVYATAEANSNMLSIDALVYFYISEGKPSPTFSSPNDQDIGYYYPTVADWYKKNYTLYDVGKEFEDLSQQYEETVNSLGLLRMYDNVNGKRKYRWATSGTIIPFKTQRLQGKEYLSKIGMIKVLHADTIPDGYIEFDIKIEE